VEWVKSSWLRIPIEMGVEGGLREYWVALEGVMRASRNVDGDDAAVVEDEDKIDMGVEEEGRGDVTDQDVEWMIGVMRRGVGIHWRLILGGLVIGVGVQVLMVRWIVYRISRVI
jgi:hypothetical protein